MIVHSSGWKWPVGTNTSNHLAARRQMRASEPFEVDGAIAPSLVALSFDSSVATVIYVDLATDSTRVLAVPLIDDQTSF